MNEETGILSREEKMMLTPRIAPQDLLAYLDAHKASIEITIPGDGGRSVMYRDGSWWAMAWVGGPGYEMTLRDLHCATLTEALQKLVMHEVTK